MASGQEITGSINFTMDSASTNVIYPCGRHIGIRNVGTNDMKFIKQAEHLKEITAMALSPNRRFLAVCERHWNTPRAQSAFISLYDLKSSDGKLLKAHIDVSETEPSSQKLIKSVAFSHDSKNIAVVYDGPERKAIVWEAYNKNKIIGQYDFGKQTVNRICFKPDDSHVVSTSGHGHWKLWRPQENTFNNFRKLTLNKETHIYTDHTWLMYERMAATTQEGEIVIVEDFEEKQLIDNAFMTEDVHRVTCIREFSKGFVVGSDKGHMAMWVRSEENNQSTGKEGQLFDFVRTWRLSTVEMAPVVSIDISP